jgi:hypothetical protein
MPTTSEVLGQPELRKLDLMHVDKVGSSRTLQVWAADEGFPDEDELALLIEMHGEPGRYRVMSRVGKRAGRSATVRMVKGDSKAEGPKSQDGVLATQLVRMAAEVTKMAQCAMQSATEEKKEAMSLLREQAEEIAELRVQLAKGTDRPSVSEQVVEGAIDALTSNPQLATMATQGATALLAKVTAPAKKATPSGSP